MTLASPGALVDEMAVQSCRGVFGARAFMSMVLVCRMRPYEHRKCPRLKGFAGAPARFDISAR
jgi:hypothetical protein